MIDPIREEVYCDAKKYIIIYDHIDKTFAIASHNSDIVIRNPEWKTAAPAIDFAERRVRERDDIE